MWDLIKQTVMLILMFAVVRLGNRSIEQAQVGFSRAGRTARRIGAYRGLEPAARRFAALQYRFRFGVTGWQAPMAVHDAVSVLEEVVGYGAGRRTASMADALQLLRKRQLIHDDLARRISLLYVERNRIRGAGHGVGELDTTHAANLLRHVSQAIDDLLDEGVLPESERRNGYLRSWSLLLNWRDVA